MKIREKLTLGFLLLSSIVVVVGLIAFKEIKEIEGRFYIFAYEAFPLVEAIEEIQFNAVRIADSAYEYAVIVAEKQHAKGKQKHDPLEDTHRLEEESKKQFFKYLADFEKLASKSAPEYDDFLRDIKKVSSDLIQKANTLIELKKSGKFGDEVIALELRLDKAERTLHKIIEVALRHEEQELNEQIDGLRDNIWEAKLTFLVATILSFLISIILSLFFAKTLSVPIVNLTIGAEEIAKTKFDTRVEVPNTQDEIRVLAESFNEMAESLGRTTVSRDYFQAVVNSMNNCMIVLFPDGRIREVNQTTCYTLLYRDTELVGEHISKILNLEDFAQGGSEDNLSFLGFVNNISIVLAAKDQSEVPVLFSGATMSDADGELGGYVCVAQSLGEFKKLKKQV